MRTSRSALTGLLAGAGALGLMLSGCATTAQRPAAEPDTPQPMTDAAAPFRAQFSTTVIDSGDDPQACAGAIAASYPPQCGGLPLDGWDWTALAGHFEEQSGVRWGDFLVTGEFTPASKTFTVVSAEPAIPLQQDVASPWGFSPCEELDPGHILTLEELEAYDQGDSAAYAGRELAQSAGHEAARAREGYAISWSYGEILNVMTAGDLAATEKAVREVFDGPLCVTSATYSEVELQGILDEVMAGRDDVFTAQVDAAVPVIEVNVLYDDGSFQTSVDEEYGAGLVQITSWLTPMSS